MVFFATVSITGESEASRSRAMRADMELSLIVRVNSLWAKVYPYLAKYVLTHCSQSANDVLEIGPFSGIDSMAFAQQLPDFMLRIGDALE